MLRSFSSLSARSLLAVPALLGLALVAAAGCSDGSEDPAQGPTQVEGKGDLNSTSQAVSLASLQMVNGTYGAGCTSRSGAWSLPLSGYGGALDNTALSVVTNDAACTLTVTGIKASGTLYSATPVIPMGTNFAGSASIFQSPAGANVVSTVAGTGGGGSADGAAASATFSNPWALTADSAGNIYVADSDAQKIRKITPGGVVSTLAGTGACAFADGPGASAQFCTPSGIAVDNAGNVYVSDLNNHRIRKITPGGTVSTLAGTSSAGSADGAPGTGQLSFPRQLAIDAAGDLYTADNNHRIRKITSTGTISTVAGSSQGFADGPAASAQFNNPVGVAVDGAGNLYVGDASNHRVRKITPGGIVSTLAGSGTAGFADGTGAAAQFNFLEGVASDASGNIYVADRTNRRFRKVTPAGVVTTIAGDGTSGFADGTPGKFNTAVGVAIDPPSGNVLVADGFNNRIRKITLGGSGELFYGNAKVNTATFAANFVVNLLLSDDPSTASATNTAIFASVSGSSQTDLVAPPNYTPSTAGLSVQVDVNRLVTSISGSLLLTDGANTGSGYVVDLGTLPASPTFTQYDTAYNAGSAVAIAGANPTVPGSSLLAAGVQLPATRTVIVRRSDNGVIAYQAIKITFNGP